MTPVLGLISSPKVVTWGDDACGGDSSSVQSELSDVQCLGKASSPSRGGAKPQTLNPKP